jgi:hypothetical protein
MNLRLVMFLIYTVYLLGIEWGAAIVGQRCKRSTWQDAYKWLVILCWVTAVEETTSTCLMFLRVDHDIILNVWAYFETGGIIFIQLQLLTNRWAKRLLITLLFVLTAGTGINYIWGPPMNDFNPRFQLFTLFIQLITTCAALIDILGEKTSDKSLSAQPVFWLDVGMLFFCSIFMLIYIIGMFSKIPGSFGWFILACSTVANTFMYGGFIATFKTLRRQDRQKNPVPSAA